MCQPCETFPKLLHVVGKVAPSVVETQPPAAKSQATRPGKFRSGLQRMGNSLEKLNRDCNCKGTLLPPLKHLRLYLLSARENISCGATVFHHEEQA